MRYFKSLDRMVLAGTAMKRGDFQAAAKALAEAAGEDDFEDMLEAVNQGQDEALNDGADEGDAEEQLSSLLQRFHKKTSKQTASDEGDEGDDVEELEEDEDSESEESSWDDNSHNEEVNVGEREPADDEVVARLARAKHNQKVLSKTKSKKPATK